MIEVNGQKRLMHEIRRGWLERNVARQMGVCYYCRCALSPSAHPSYRDWTPTLDHIVPLSKGGEDREDNTVAACHACNHDKADMEVWEFRLIIERRRAEWERLGADKAVAL